MDDFTSLEKNIIRELSCRLCLCTDVVKLKPLNAEMKRKLKKLFGIIVRTDDSLPKAICHDCLQQINNMHLYAVKVEKTQKFLEFRSIKTSSKEKKESEPQDRPMPVIADFAMTVKRREEQEMKPISPSKLKKPVIELHQGDIKETTSAERRNTKKKSLTKLKFMEDMPLDEFLKTEKIDMSLLTYSPGKERKINKVESKKVEKEKTKEEEKSDIANESLDPIVLVDGRPAKEGSALDKQITLFYKMECCICQAKGFNFRSLMKHYKDRHGVPGYVTCCDKKFHYFHPKKIIEHMAYHLQPNIFMCKSCHQNFQSSQELHDHQINGGRSEGKILCPRCSERYPTYRELGCHIITHRTNEKPTSCDYCAKALKYHHRKRTVNYMEDLILCSHCVRTLKNIEKHERELKEKMKSASSTSSHNTNSHKHQKFRQAMGLSADDETSTD